MGHREGNFTYVSDPNEHPIQWHNWYEGEPNNYANGEDCVYGHVYGHDQGKWNDMDCKEISEFICEKPINGSSKIFSNFVKKDTNSTEKPNPTSFSTTTQNPSINQVTNVGETTADSTETPNLLSVSTTTQNPRRNTFTLTKSEPNASLTVKEGNSFELR